jgi:hypothetical protein
MTEQLRDVQINWMGKLEAEDSKNLYEKLAEQFDSHIPLHVARLQALDSGSPPAGAEAGSPSANTSSNELNGSCSSPRQEASSAASTGVKPPKTPETCREMILIADKILGMIDQPALLAFFGTRSSSQSESAKTKQAMEKQRTAVIEALVKKGIAVAELLKTKSPGPITSSGTPHPTTVETLDDILFDVLKYVDINDFKVSCSLLVPKLSWYEVKDLS